MKKFLAIVLVLFLTTSGLTWAQESSDSGTSTAAKSHSHKKSSKKSKKSKKKKTSKSKKGSKSKKKSKNKTEIKNESQIGQSDVTIDLKGQ